MEQKRLPSVDLHEFPKESLLNRLTSFEKENVADQERLARVLVLYTGGTIGMVTKNGGLINITVNLVINTVMVLRARVCVCILCVCLCALECLCCARLCVWMSFSSSIEIESFSLP